MLGRNGKAAELGDRSHVLEIAERQAAERHCDLFAARIADAYGRLRISVFYLFPLWLDASPAGREMGAPRPDQEAHDVPTHRQAADCSAGLVEA
jgi:hypothetical protein